MSDKSWNEAGQQKSWQEITRQDSITHFFVRVYFFCKPNFAISYFTRNLDSMKCKVKRNSSRRYKLGYERNKSESLDLLSQKQTIIFYNMCIRFLIFASKSVMISKQIVVVCLFSVPIWIQKLWKETLILNPQAFA